MVVVVLSRDLQQKQQHSLVSAVLHAVVLVVMPCLKRAKKPKRTFSCLEPSTNLPQLRGRGVQGPLSPRLHTSFCLTLPRRCRALGVSVAHSLAQLSCRAPHLWRRAVLVDVHHALLAQVNQGHQVQWVRVRVVIGAGAAAAAAGVQGREFCLTPFLHAGVAQEVLSTMPSVLQCCALQHETWRPLPLIRL
jgi:hypothetical protein